MSRSFMFGVVICAEMVCLAFTSPAAYAALHDRGINVGVNDGFAGAAVNYHLIYDDTLDLTWVDYTFGWEVAGASGFGSTYYTQSQYWQTKAWADTLSITFNGEVFDDWRLPQVVPVGDLNFAYDGSTDKGYNVTRAGSELAHLYHVTLGNLSKFETNGTMRAAGTYGLLNTDLFQNLVGTPGGSGYWTETIYPDGTGNVFGTVFAEGLQSRFSNQSGNQEWGLAVREGDVVPEPSALVLLTCGALFSLLKRRRKPRP